MGEILGIMPERRKGMKRVFWTLIAVSLLIFFVLAPFILMLGPAGLRDYLHRELVYKVIADRVTSRAKSDREKALGLFYYVHTHLFTPEGAESVDKHPLNDLIRGIGWCDQQANTLITLARKAGIKGRLIFLRGYAMNSQHSVCDLYIDGKYRIFDPEQGVFFLNEEGEIATFADIRDKNRKIRSEQFEALRVFQEKGQFQAMFLRLFEPKYPPKFFRDNFSSDLKRRLLSKTVDFYYSAFGKLFLALFQEYYFKLAGTEPFLKARFEHLAFRFKPAIKGYDDIINETDSEFRKSESVFFKGQAFWDSEKYTESISVFGKLLEEFPQTRWKNAAMFYMGDSYENIGNYDRAKACYSRVSKSGTPAQARLMKLTETEQER